MIEKLKGIGAMKAVSQGERIVHEPASLEAIQEARQRLAGIALRTPLIRLDVDDAPAEIYLKL